MTFGLAGLASRPGEGATVAARESAAEHARRAAEAAAVLRAKADAAEAAAARWEAGRDGEERLSTAIDELARYGYRQLPDRSFPGRSSNLDLVVIGPAGVFVLDAKNWSGTLEFDGKVMRHNGRRRAQEIESVRGQAAMVAELLDQHGYGAVPVRPALCFMGSAKVGGYRPMDRVHLVDGEHVAGWIFHLEPALDPEWIDATVAFLEHMLSPRVGHDVGEAVPPDEPVVFLTPWFKYGKRRLYVRDEEGADGGYLDLVSGDVVGTSAAAESVLRRMLVHYAEVDDGEMSADDRGAICRFLDSFRLKPSAPAEVPLQLVVGQLWRGRGMQRLYVHRLTFTDEKVELGFYDLNDGLAICGNRADEPVVRYCGRCYANVVATRGT